MRPDFDAEDALEEAAPMNQSPQSRQIAAIHCGKRQLHLDDATYRQLLSRVAGVNSAADLSDRGRRAVLDELRRLGAGRPTPRGARGRAQPGQYPGTPHNIDSKPMLTKIGALLADQNLPWDYANSVSRRMFHVHTVAWLQPDQMRAVIAALHSRQQKKRKEALSRARCGDAEHGAARPGMA